MKDSEAAVPLIEMAFVCARNPVCLTLVAGSLAVIYYNTVKDNEFNENRDENIEYDPNVNYKKTYKEGERSKNPNQGADTFGTNNGFEPDDDNDWQKNPSKAESPVWNELKPYKGKTRTNGLSGKDRLYYEWDNLHNDIEVFNHKGEHIGSMDPVKGNMYKPSKGHKPSFK